MVIVLEPRSRIAASVFFLGVGCASGADPFDSSVSGFTGPPTGAASTTGENTGSGTEDGPDASGGGSGSGMSGSGVPTSGVDSSTTDPGDSTSGDSISTTDPSTGDGSTSEASTTGLSSTTDASTTSTSTTDASTTDASTTSTSTTDTSTTGSTCEYSASENLQNHNGMCSVNTGVACVNACPNITEYRGPNQTQECFTADLTPPFELSEVRYFVGNVQSNLNHLLLEIRARNTNGSPGSVIRSVTLSPSTDGAVGQRTYTFDECDRPVIASAGFCVGIRSNSTGTAGGIGISVDDNSALVDDVTWFYGSCVSNVWTDLTDVASVCPQKGNWCIDVTVVQ